MLTFLSEHLYLLGCIFLSIPFVVFYYYKPKSRRAMLEVGLLTGLTAFFFSPYSVRDYWNPIFVTPIFPFEDFLYGFFFGGFLSESSDIFFQHKFKKKKKRLVFLVLSFFVFLILYYAIVKILGLNSIWFLLLFGVILSISSFLFNRNILILQVFSGLLAVVVSFASFRLLIYIDPLFIQKCWKLHNLSGHLIAGIPIEEYLFAFIFGFGICHYYELIEGMDVKKIKLINRNKIL